MKIFKRILAFGLLVACLFALGFLVYLFVGYDNLPKNPPLTDEEPVLLARLQPSRLPSQKAIMDEFESLLTFFTDKDNEKALEDFREEFEEGEGEQFLSAWFDLLKKLKKNHVKNCFLVFERDCLPVTGGYYEPFATVDVHDLSASQIKSATNALQDFSDDVRDVQEKEISVFEEGGYLITNFRGNELTWEKNQSDHLEKKVSDDMLDDWPEDLRKGLAKYQYCALSAVGKLPSASSFYKEMQEELEDMERQSDGKGRDFAKIARKGLKNLKNVDYYAVGVDFMKKTVMISFFMESAEDAEEFKENSIKCLNEFVKMVTKNGDFDVDKKDIEKFANEIHVTQSGNVLTYSFSEEWLKAQRSFIKKWEPKESKESTASKGVMDSNRKPLFEEPVEDEPEPVLDKDDFDDEDADDDDGDELFAKTKAFV